MLPRSKFRSIAVCAAVGVIVIALAIWAYRRQSKIAFDSAWRGDLKALGALVVSNRSSTSIPFINIRFITEDFVVHVTEAKTADAAVERAIQNPALNSIFLFPTAVSGESVNSLAGRIHRSRPDVRVMLVDEDKKLERWVPPAQ